MGPRPRWIALSLALAGLATACGTSAPTSPAPSGGGLDRAGFVAQVASSDLYVGPEQRVQVGVYANDPQAGVLLVTSGTVEVRLEPFEGGPGTPVAGWARYVPAYGTAVGDGPTLSPPDVARGVYQLDGVRFDAPGVWAATVRAVVDGREVEVRATPFTVTRRPRLPAPGDRALPTRNLTLRDDAPPEAIDSRAASGAEIPDPELHRWTIARALAAGVPALVTFSTPAFCQSLFCGPVTDAVSDLHDRFGDRAVFIHVEVWREHPSTLNEAAADWLYRDGDLTEPWLFLIDARGRILDRWAPLFDVEEVARALERLPRRLPS